MEVGNSIHEVDGPELKVCTGGSESPSLGLWWIRQFRFANVTALRKAKCEGFHFCAARVLNIVTPPDYRQNPYPVSRARRLRDLSHGSRSGAKETRHGARLW